MTKQAQSKQLIHIVIREQILNCYDADQLIFTFFISSSKKGPGELQDSGCTPRGWHQIYSKIGLDCPINSVFVGRKWTSEIYSSSLRNQYPDRDWILTRILQLDGLELGRNKGGHVDSLNRFIYIHGTPDDNPVGKPGSHGCIRMRNTDLLSLVNWVNIGTYVYID